MKLHFLFDENMPARLAQGLELMDQENKDGVNINVQISHVVSIYGRGLEDQEIVRKAKSLGAIIVSEDDDYKNITATKQLVKQLKVGVVIYKVPKHGVRYWEKSLAFINAWEEIKDLCRSLNSPYLIRVDKKGAVYQEAL